jgi:hypothetical protein
MLEPGSWPIQQLLMAIPRAIPLWEASDDQIGTGSAAWTLWDLLRHRADNDLTGTGRVTTSKLLARKRPLLIPIQDSVVTGALGEYQGNFWSAMREAFQDEGLRDRLSELHVAARSENQHVRSRSHCSECSTSSSG